MVKPGILSVFCCLVLLSCGGSGESTDAITITLTKDSSAVVIAGLGSEITGSIQRDSLTAEELQTIIAVYLQDANEELQGLENPLPGSYQVNNGQVIFTPAAPFSKGNIYRAETRLPSYYAVESTPGKSKLPGTGDVKAEIFVFK